MISLLCTMFYILCMSNLVQYAAAENLLECKDENNKAVDWFVLYKLPKLSESSNSLIRKGLAYAYMSSDSVNDGWMLSNKEISDRTSIPGNTLAPLYENTRAANALWLLYNDDPPDGSAVSRYGHAKGVAMADQERGYWLIHSVPNFPPKPITDVDLCSENGCNLNAFYDYPTSARQYGQSFLCITLSSNEFDTIGKQLMYNQILVYSKNLPAQLSKLYRNITNAANGVRVKTAPYNAKTTIKSLTSVEFVSFAKSDKWQKELYSDFVAPQLGSDMYVESWLHGRGRLPSTCTGIKVYNVESVFLEMANINFSSSNDHSKWAIAVNGKKNRAWICIADINRADTQYNRGGGAVCLNSFNVWKNYRGVVKDVEPCPRRTWFQMLRSWFG